MTRTDEVFGAQFVTSATALLFFFSYQALRLTILSIVASAILGG